MLGYIRGPLGRGSTAKTAWDRFSLYISHKFEVKLHQEGNSVTAAYGYWLVAMGKGSAWVGSIRGPLCHGLTIWSPEMGLEKWPPGFPN